MFNYGFKRSWFSPCPFAQKGQLDVLSVIVWKKKRLSYNHFASKRENGMHK